MPFIDSKVSVKTTKEQKKALKEGLGKVIALIPGKSESWLMINLADEQEMFFRGSDDAPMAYIAVNIYGSDDREGYEKMTEALTQLYGDVLGIAPDHMYIKYAASYDWGWNGSNF